MLEITPECRLRLQTQTKPALRLQTYAVSCSNYFMLIPSPKELHTVSIKNQRESHLTQTYLHMLFG